jgi:hypothetical protein
MLHNAQLSAVCPELVESSKIAELPNHCNSIHEALRFTSQKPEPQKMKRAMKFQNGQSSGQAQMLFQEAH